MSILILVVVILISTFLFVKLYKNNPRTRNLPNGSFGYPFIGETFSFLQAQKKDRTGEWINERVKKYGPVFKTSLLGAPTVIMVGQSGNKFFFGSDENVLSAKQPRSLTSVIGKYNIFDLSGSRYQLIKGALSIFMKPAILQTNIKQMDDIITHLFLKSTEKSDIVTINHFIKRLTLHVASRVLFGIQDETLLDEFADDLTIAFKGIWSIPFNFPGTTYWHAMRARSRIIASFNSIIMKKREDLREGILNRTSDVISSMIDCKAQNEEVINEEMIIDNCIVLMIAGHDTNSSLLCAMIWKMSKDPQIYRSVLEEQMEIQRDIEGRDDKNLTWDDIHKMKYTWRVAQESMRVIPLASGTFRKVTKDTTFDGFDIPKGWQVFWSAYLTNMDNNIFVNPKEFDPSRFETSMSKTIPPFAYLPFGSGQHACIGYEFAKVETLIVIHRLVTMYEWSLIYPDEVIT